jgi:hypothetical protein
MRGITQFETSDLNAIMAWYLTGKVTMRQLCDELNARLREKAEQERNLDEREYRTGNRHRPNCF